MEKYFFDSCICLFSCMTNKAKNWTINFEIHCWRLPSVESTPFSRGIIHYSAGIQNNTRKTWTEKAVQPPIAVTSTLWGAPSSHAFPTRESGFMPPLPLPTPRAGVFNAATELPDGPGCCGEFYLPINFSVSIHEFAKFEALI